MTNDINFDSGHGGSPELGRERLLARLIRALDEGDGWALEEILEAAQSDIELERLIGEVNLAWLEEQGIEPLADASLAFHIARKHLSSPPPPRSVELHVDEIADYLLRQGVRENEKDVVSQLAKATLPVPTLLSRANLEMLARQLGASADARFWRRFKNAVIMMRMQRTTPQSQLALAREAKLRHRSSGHLGVSTSDISVSRSEDELGEETQ